MSITLKDREAMLQILDETLRNHDALLCYVERGIRASRDPVEAMVLQKQEQILRQSRESLRRYRELASVPSDPDQLKLFAICQ